MAFHFYNNLYMKDATSASFALLATTFHTLPTEIIAFLAKPFDADEVKLAVFDMDPYKAPSPYGFQACFYQKS